MAYPGIQSNWLGEHTNSLDYGSYAWLDKTQQWLGDAKNLSTADSVKAELVRSAQAVNA